MMDSKKNQAETRQIENLVGNHKQTAVNFLELVATGRIEEAYRRYAAAPQPIFPGGFPGAAKGDAGEL
jgi:hypothetical protein